MVGDFPSVVALGCKGKCLGFGGLPGMGNTWKAKIDLTSWLSDYAEGNDPEVNHQQLSPRNTHREKASGHGDAPSVGVLFGK